MKEEGEAKKGGCALMVVHRTEELLVCLPSRD